MSTLFWPSKSSTAEATGNDGHDVKTTVPIQVANCHIPTAYGRKVDIRQLRERCALRYRVEKHRHAASRVRLRGDLLRRRNHNEITKRRRLTLPAKVPRRPG